MIFLCCVVSKVAPTEVWLDEDTGVKLSDHTFRTVTEYFLAYQSKLYFHCARPAVISRDSMTVLFHDLVKHTLFIIIYM